MRLTFILTRANVYGGAQIHVRDMCRHLIEDGHDVEVLIGSGGLVPPLLSESGVPYQQIPTLCRDLSPWRDLRAFWGILRALVRRRPQLVSTHTAKAGALGRIACLILRIPVLYTPHCWAFVDGLPAARLHRMIERLLAGTTTRFVAVSENERRFGIEAGVCTESEILTVHNGMPDSAGCQADPSRDPPRLVMVARFEAQKDHRTLIDALGCLRDLDWSLTLVGDGPLLPMVQAQVAAHGLTERVCFAGRSKTVHLHLAQSQIFVLSALWESFPRSILEAMRAGLPVVASDVGGCSEAVADGVNGFAVKLRAVDELADRLRLLVTDSALRVRMGAASRRRYEEAFTFQTMYSRYLALFRTHAAPQHALQGKDVALPEHQPAKAAS